MATDLGQASAAGVGPEHVLVLALASEQAGLIRMLGEAGLTSRPCRDLRELTRELAAGAGALLLAEEALGGGAQPLRDALRAQPAWSDLPFILLADEATDSAASARISEQLGNVTVLERPVHAFTLVSALWTAIRSRRRQYELRDKVEELRRSEERARLVAEAVSESIWDLDVPTGRIWSSESVRSIFGYGSGEVVAHVGAWIHRQHPEDRARVNESFQRALAGDETFWTEEYRFQKADGSWAHVLDRARILRDDRGVALRVVGATMDLSERKQAEEVRALHAAIVESSEDAIVSKDLRGTILSWNRGAERLFGYTAEEVIGKNITIVIPPDRQGEEVAILARIARGQRIEHFETVRQSKQGRLLYLSLTVSPVRDASGRIIGASKVARDVTARRIANDMLRKKSEGLRLLWDSASVLLYAEEPAPMMRALFGLIAPHLQLDVYFNFVPDPDGDALRLQSYAGIPEEEAEKIARLELGESACGLAAQRRERIVASCVQQSADPKLDRMRSYGVRAYVCNPMISEGRLLGTLSFGSRRRDAFEPDELELLQTISHYVTVACERWHLLQQLRHTDRRKDEFLATLAHELRNPLAPISNALQILSLSDDRDSLELARAMMERQLGQLVRLIDDLLDVSRITMGKLELRRERVSLSSILENAIETTRPLIDASGHALQVEASPAPVYVDADPVRLAQVFSNLLNNAAKYMERGGQIRVEVETRGDDVCVTVSDTGTGIPPEALPSIFEMFAQVDRSLERSQGGLGIGLTLVKRLVELHGGRVEVRSEGHGKGTQVSVHLPVAGTWAARAASKPDAALGARAFGFRILVADDNLDAADSLAVMLRMMGNEVHTVHDGEQALEEGAVFRPDIILLDIGMPRMNGYDAARRIREEHWGKRAALVALTGWGQDEDKRRAREAGFDRHFTKPVSPDDLEALLSGLPAELRSRGPAATA